MQRHLSIERRSMLGCRVRSPAHVKPIPERAHPLFQRDHFVRRLMGRFVDAYPQRTLGLLRQHVLAGEQRFEPVKRTHRPPPVVSYSPVQVYRPVNRS